MRTKCTVLIAILCALLSSCAVTQVLNFTDVSEEAFGDAQSYLKADTFLVDVLEDLSCWTGTEEDNAFLDVAVTSVAQSIAQSDYSRYVYIYKDNENSYIVNFGFTDFSSLIQTMAGDTEQNIISLEEDDAGTTLSFNLSMDNYHYLEQMIPILADPNFEAYGPVYNNPPYDNRTAEDYVSMMEFIFGEGAKDIETSTVKIVFNAPSPIIATSGKLVSPESTEFEFALLDFLLLHDPVKFFCKY